MRNVIVKYQGDENGILATSQEMVIPGSSRIIDSQSKMLPDGTYKTLLRVKPLEDRALYLDETIESFTEILQGQCCEGSGGSGGSGSGGGMFEATIASDGPTYQDDRLIGSDVIAFILDGTTYQRGTGSFTFDSTTGTITLTSPPFATDSILTIWYGVGSSLKMTGVAGTTIVNANFVNRVVTAIVIDNSVLNTGYTKALNSNTITLTSPTTLVGGEVITVIFG